MKAAFLIGRLVFGGFFLYNGINHLKERKSLAQYAQTKNVPLANAVVAGTGLVLIAGGTSILLGVKPKLGTAAIAGFLACVSPVMHDFWRINEPNQRMNEMINFSKNMALLGSALALMGVDEPWPASIPISQDEVEARGYESGSRIAEALWLRAKRHKFSSHISVAADGVHGKPELPAPGQQPAGAGRNVPGDAIALEYISNVPVADEHVLYSEPVQDIHLARTVRLVDDPIRFGIRRQIVSAECGNVLNPDDDISAAVVSIVAIIAPAIVIVISLRRAVVAISSPVPPVAFTAISGVRCGRLMREPGQHFLRLSLGLRRHGLRRLGVKLIEVTKELGIDYQKRDPLDLEAIVVRPEDAAVFLHVIAVDIVVSRRVVHRCMQPFQDAAGAQPFVVVLANIAAHDHRIRVARVHHVNRAAQVIEGVR